MIRRVWAVLALFSLALCLAFPILHFLGRMAAADFRLGLLLASLGWFLFASLWVARRKKA